MGALIFLILLGGADVALARKYLHRSSKGLMMGDAYLTLAEGSNTLFYNPAMAVRNNLFAIYLLPIDGGLINILEESSRFKMIREGGGGSLQGFTDAFIGYPLDIRGGIVPTIKFGWFTLSLFNTVSAELVIHDQTHPVLWADAAHDQGFALGFGIIPYGHGGRGQSLAVGVSVKSIKRKFIRGDYDVFGTTFVDLLDSGNLSLNKLQDLLGYSSGEGVGFDFGFDWRYKTPQRVLAFGASVLDILDTKIDRTEGKKLDLNQPMAVNLGSSYSHRWGRSVDLTLALDFQSVLVKGPLKEKLRSGITPRYSLIRLYGGL